MRGGCLVFSCDQAMRSRIKSPQCMGQPVTRLYLRRDRDPPLRKIQAENYCECGSAQVLQTKRSFLEMLLFPESAIFLPESRRDGPLLHQKWGQVNHSCWKV